MPLLSWETFSEKTVSATTPDTLSAGASPGLLTPIDESYQPNDSLLSYLSPNNMQQQAMRLLSLTRPYVSEPDESTIMPTL